MDTGTNTFEMAQAFSAFANGGEFKEAFAIKQIKDNKGKVVFENKGKEREARNERFDGFANDGHDEARRRGRNG